MCTLTVPTALDDSGSGLNVAVEWCDSRLLDTGLPCPDLRGAILAAEGRVFGTIGMPELILIFVVALLLFGPRKMPQIGRSIGRALGEFRRASNDFKRTIEDEVAADEIREVERDLKEIRQVGHDVVKQVDDSVLDGEPQGGDST